MPQLLVNLENLFPKELVTRLGIELPEEQLKEITGVQLTCERDNPLCVDIRTCVNEQYINRRYINRRFWLTEKGWVETCSSMTRFVTEKDM